MTMQYEARLGYVPQFDVTALDGRHMRYDEIWQRRNLILVIVEPQEREAATRYAAQLEAHLDEIEHEDTTVVVTADAIPGLSAPAALVADRWGEILHIETASSGPDSSIPDIEELSAWVHFAEIQCPECPP